MDVNFYLMLSLLKLCQSNQLGNLGDTHKNYTKCPSALFSLLSLAMATGGQSGRRREGGREGEYVVRVGFNGSGPVQFLAQYSVQTLIRSRSRSTLVTVRFGLSFGLKFSNVKIF